MSDWRPWQEAAERCISVMVFYHNAQKSPDVDAWMADELRAIGAWVVGQGASPRAAERWIIRPVEDGLIERFGYEVGPRLTSIFARNLGATSPRPMDAVDIGKSPGPNGGRPSPTLA